MAMGWVTNCVPVPWPLLKCCSCMPFTLVAMSGFPLLLLLDTWLRASDPSAPLNSMVPPPWLVSWIGASPLPGCTNPLFPTCPLPVLLRFAGLGWVLLLTLGVPGGDLLPLSFFLLTALSHWCLLYLMLQSTPTSV